MKPHRTAFVILLLVALASGDAAAGPEIPGQTPAEPIALVGGIVHPVSKPAIEDGVVVFRRGRIIAVGPRAKVKIPEGAKIIDTEGKHVYPGLFDPNTNLGLVEINAVRATVDFAEAGSVNPNVKAHVSVNPDSELIPVTRSSGVLLAATAPTGGLISGKASVLQLDGWTYEDLTLRGEVGLMVNWPGMPAVGNWTGSGGSTPTTALASLNKLFDDARAYRKARDGAPDRQPIDARLQAMQPILDGKTPLIARANDLQRIQAAVAFAQSQRVKLIILGGYDAGHCVDLLKRHNVPVIISGVYRLPRRRADAYDQAFTLPERLRRAGVRFCISSSGRFGGANVRNLPHHAAMAAAFGLPQDVALKAITLYPAQILGVAKRVGSLEKGRDATLFIADGDILDAFTHVEAAFVRGAPVDLDDRHKRLYRKYKERIRRSK